MPRLPFLIASSLGFLAAVAVSGAQTPPPADGPALTSTAPATTTAAAAETVPRTAPPTSTAVPATPAGNTVPTSTAPPPAPSTTGGASPGDGSPARTKPAAEAPSLSLALSTAPSLGILTPGSTASSAPAALRVTAVGTAWSLRVAADGSAGSPGRLRASRTPECRRGTEVLDRPLRLSVTAASASTVVDRPEYDLGALPNPRLAHGSASDVVWVVYRQRVGRDEQFAAGCAYSVSMTWTLSG